MYKGEKEIREKKRKEEKKKNLPYPLGSADTDPWPRPPLSLTPASLRSRPTSARARATLSPFSLFARPHSSAAPRSCAPAPPLACGSRLPAPSSSPMLGINEIPAGHRPPSLFAITLAPAKLGTALPPCPLFSHPHTTSRPKPSRPQRCAPLATSLCTSSGPAGFGHFPPRAPIKGPPRAPLPLAPPSATLPPLPWIQSSSVSPPSFAPVSSSSPLQ